jgi:hypothetical protein
MSNKRTQIHLILRSKGDRKAIIPGLLPYVSYPTKHVGNAYAITEGTLED